MPFAAFQISKTFNISGREMIPYIELMTAKAATKSSTRVVYLGIPFSAFSAHLRLADKNPPFTTQQLEALVTPETFEYLSYWPAIFN